MLQVTEETTFFWAQLCLFSTACGSSNDIPQICLFSTPLAALESCAPVSHGQHDARLLREDVSAVTGGGAAEDNRASKGCG